MLFNVRFLNTYTYFICNTVFIKKKVHIFGKSLIMTQNIGNQSLCDFNHLLYFFVVENTSLTCSNKYIISHIFTVPCEVFTIKMSSLQYWINDLLQVSSKYGRCISFSLVLILSYHKFFLSEKKKNFKWLIFVNVQI